MRFSQHFKLKKTQRELDFVDIDLEKDTELFIDPWLLKEYDTDFSQKCTHYLQSFFTSLLEHINKKDKNGSLKLLDHLHEVNWTRLGYAKNNIQGHAIATEHAGQIYDTLLRSKAVRTKVLKDLEDTALLIPGIDKDKISDMVTNIIMPLLVEYTAQQIKLHDIDTPIRKFRWYLWSTKDKKWTIETIELPFFNGRPILLVPKNIVTANLSVNSKDFYNKYILTYEQQRHLNNPSLGLCRVLKNKTVVPPTKKRLKAEVPYTNDEIVKYVERHPELLQSYKQDLRKNHTVKKSRKTKEQVIDDRNRGGNISPKARVNQLIEELRSIPPGTKDAGKYHTLVAGILTFLFGQNLTNIQREDPISGNTKFIDLSFLNSAEKGFFLNCVKLNIPCRKIYFECKNYTEDVANNELDQLLGRFGANTTRIGFIVCRDLENRGLFIKRCGHEVGKNRNYAIVLTDQDLVQMLKNKAENNAEANDQLLDSRLEEINSYLSSN